MIYTNGKCIIADSVFELCEFAKENGLSNACFRHSLFTHQGNKYISSYYKIWGNTRKAIMRDDRVYYVTDPQNFRAIIILLYN